MSQYMMTPEEIELARRIIGLRGTAFTARKNRWTLRMKKDLPVLESLIDKGYVIADDYRMIVWKMSQRGIQQLKLQIGEFTIRR